MGILSKNSEEQEQAESQTQEPVATGESKPDAPAKEPKSKAPAGAVLTKPYGGVEISVFADGKAFRWFTEKHGKSKDTFVSDKEAAFAAQRALDKN